MICFGSETGKTKFVNEPDDVVVSFLTLTAEIASNTKSYFHDEPVSSKCNPKDIIFGILFGPNSTFAFYISSYKL